LGDSPTPKTSKHSVKYFIKQYQQSNNSKTKPTNNQQPKPTTNNQQQQLQQ